jgi:hypothetical protein
MNEPNSRFKIPISLLSIATVTVAAILLTIFVVTHGHVQGGAEVLLVFALILFGPVSLFYLVLDSPWPITIEGVGLLTATPALLLAAAFWRSRYSVVLKRVGWFFWMVCSLFVAGFYI